MHPLLVTVLLILPPSPPLQADYAPPPVKSQFNRFDWCGAHGYLLLVFHSNKKKKKRQE